MSRAHMIGQQDVVNIYRFVTSKSVEEDILERAKKKMVLDHLVIQKLNAEGRLEKKESKKTSMFDKNELSAILKFGAEELFKEDKNDEESKRRLESMDIDEILERAEKVETKGADEEPGKELLSAFKVANFCNAEDDGTFWSRLIQPDPLDEANEELAPPPRAARNIKSYAENRPDTSNKRRKRGPEPRERVQRRSTRASDSSISSLPIIEGASAQVRSWSFGNLTKRDASQFVRAVKKFGNDSQISSIVAEVGGVIETAPYEAQIELFDMLIDGCREAVKEGNMDVKGPILDFFGVSVKANEVLNRVEELQLLAKRIKRYKDPVAQFRLTTHHKSPQWSKSCDWNQVDDARLLLGIHYHGYGNWEKIRMDSSLGLTRKIAPASLGERETFLPRAPNMDNRASALLQKEFANVHGKLTKGKGSRRNEKIEEEVIIKSSTRSRPNPKLISRVNKELKPKHQKVAHQVKEEGEISGSEQDGNYTEQDKEDKWVGWCNQVMEGEIVTLTRLERLQNTSVELPKEKVLARIRNYLQQLGTRIDEILEDHKSQGYRKSKLATMKTRLWDHVSKFSNLTGEQLRETYLKLKEDMGRDGAGSSHYQNNNKFKNKQKPQNFQTQNMGAPNPEPWKHRRRENINNSQQYYMHPPPLPPYPLQAPVSDMNPNSAGILGWGPSDLRRFTNGRPKGHFPQGQR